VDTGLLLLRHLPYGVLDTAAETSQRSLVAPLACSGGGSQRLADSDPRVVLDEPPPQDLLYLVRFSRQHRLETLQEGTHGRVLYLRCFGRVPGRELRQNALDAPLPRYSTQKIQPGVLRDSSAPREELGVGIGTAAAEPPRDVQQCVAYDVVD
jgi:hypothetical protein